MEANFCCNEREPVNSLGDQSNFIGDSFQSMSFALIQDSL